MKKPPVAGPQAGDRGRPCNEDRVTKLRQLFFGATFFIDFLLVAFFAIGFLPARQSFCACESQA